MPLWPRQLRPETDMSDKPILFSAPMIKAILREIETPGTGKTQTRRIYKSIPASEPQQYNVGDRLWVRENWRPHGANNGLLRDQETSTCTGPQDVMFQAGAPEEATAQFRFFPSIHMPRWASRITLEVTELRYQRLQDISEQDAIAEGIDAYDGMDPLCSGYRWYGDQAQPGQWLPPINSFRSLWDSLNGTPRKPGGPDISWSANPWIVAITFRPHLCNIDRLEVAA